MPLLTKVSELIFSYFQFSHSKILNLFAGTLQNLSAINSYSKEDLAQIVLAAKEINLEIIPLVQTFGHLEQALKLQEFKRKNFIHSVYKLLIRLMLINFQI